MSESVKKDFNKGLNLFGSFFMAIFTVYMCVSIHHSYPSVAALHVLLVITCLCSVMAFKRKFSYWWIYPISILLFPFIGLTFFYYESSKYMAKQKGRNVDTQKGKLFWSVCTLITVFMIFAMLVYFRIITI